MLPDENDVVSQTGSDRIEVKDWKEIDDNRDDDKVEENSNCEAAPKEPTEDDMANDLDENHAYGYDNDRELMGLLLQCAHIIRHRKGHKMGQRRVLHTLYDQGIVNQRELADQFDIRPASLSELLAKLEDKGLIERTRLAADRRNIVVSLSEQGVELLKSLDAPSFSMFAALNEEERATLYDLLKKLVHSWSAMDMEGTIDEPRMRRLAEYREQVRREVERLHPHKPHWMKDEEMEDRPCPHGPHRCHHGHDEEAMDEPLPPHHPHEHPLDAKCGMPHMHERLHAMKEQGCCEHHFDYHKGCMHPHGNAHPMPHDPAKDVDESGLDDPMDD